jgi:hypothetical protein
MQGDLGISDDQTVFTDEELQRLYERASESYPTAVYYAFRQLLADAAKLHDYSLVQTKLSKKQVFDHIKAMVEFWQSEARSAGNQVAIVGIRQIPPRWKDAPSDKKLPKRSGWHVTTEDDR